MGSPTGAFCRAIAIPPTTQDLADTLQWQDDRADVGRAGDTPAGVIPLCVFSKVEADSRQACRRAVSGLRKRVRDTSGDRGRIPARSHALSDVSAPQSGLSSQASINSSGVQIIGLWHASASAVAYSTHRPERIHRKRSSRELPVCDSSSWRPFHLSCRAQRSAVEASACELGARLVSGQMLRLRSA